MIKYFSTFSGIGGFELGIQKAIPNAECVGFSEIDKFAIQTYMKHFPTHKNYGDITKIDYDKLPDFDLLVGGFPCQSFSTAGKQKGFYDYRGTMIYHLLNILRTKRPNYFIFENVKGFLQTPFTKEREVIFDEFRSLGYNIKFQVLNTQDFGIPQDRKRVFIVGNIEGDSFHFPQAREKSVLLNSILEKNVDTSFYLEKLKSDKIKHFHDERSKSHELSTHGYDEIVSVKSSFLSSSRSSIKKNSLYTITSRISCIGVLNDYILSDIRRITPIESERFQGFPDNRTEGVSNSQRYKQCGNAVSVPVIEAIIKSMFVGE